jgi:hypothetical protein
MGATSLKTAIRVLARARVLSAAAMIAAGRNHLPPRPRHGGARRVVAATQREAPRAGSAGTKRRRAARMAPGRARRAPRVPQRRAKDPGPNPAG